MTQRIINIGTGPNTKDGDTVRNAFDKVNKNFTDFYALINGTGVGVYTGSLPPDNPTESQLWFNSEDGKIYIRYSDTWIDTSVPATNPNPFDQSLNTTDTVGFAGVVATYGFLAQINGTNPGQELVIQSGGSHNWTFKSDAGLMFPDSSKQYTAGMSFRGAWDPQGSYINNVDVVTYGGGTYLKVNFDPNSGGSPDQDNQRWQAIGSVGGGSSDRITVGGKTLSIDTNGVLSFPNSNTLDTGGPAFHIKSQQYIDINPGNYTWTFGTNGVLTLPGIEDDNTAAIDFFGAAENNHKVTLSSGWTLKIKARADGGNEGHLHLQAGGYGTRVQVNGSESNVQICATDGSVVSWYEFDKNGTITLPDSTNIAQGFINGGTNNHTAGISTYSGWNQIYAQDSGVGIQTSADGATYNTWTFGNDGTLVTPNGLKFDLYQTISAGGQSIKIIPDYSGTSYIIVPPDESGDALSISHTGSVVVTAGSTQQWQFDSSGNTTVPGDIYTTENNDLNVKIFSSTYTPGTGASFCVQNRRLDTGAKMSQFFVGPEDIVLTTDFSGDISGDKHDWTFGKDGILSVPGADGQIQSQNGANFLSLPNDTSYQTTLWGGGDGGLGLFGGNNTWIILDDSNNGKTNKVEILTDRNVTNKSWIFDGAGKLTMPNGIEITNDGAIQWTDSQLTIKSSSTSDQTVGAILFDPLSSFEPVSISVRSNTNGGYQLWSFGSRFPNSGYINWPDGTQQSTAYQTATPPVSSKGQSGDVAGMVAFDNNNFYYCKADYTNGTADIWNKMAWTNNSTWG